MTLDQYILLSFVLLIFALMLCIICYAFWMSDKHTEDEKRYMVDIRKIPIADAFPIANNIQNPIHQHTIIHSVSNTDEIV